MNPTTPPTSALSPATHLGTCTLVGAGPGDPELLTIKALKAIQAATVLLVDDLVSDAIVAHASPTARIVYVGKRGGCTSTPQAFIEKLMLMAVSEGENVVRLKGGDPFIFGRGGEEVEHLRAAGVAVSVINGITAGLAGLTSLGAPLTHREHAHGVVFVTGHAKPGDAGTNWRQLAATAREARLTLVIYMGVSGAAHIEQELLTGLPAHTPVAIIQHASLPHQRHAITTLGQLHATIEREGLASPSVIVVGDVVRGVASASQPTHDQASGDTVDYGDGHARSTQVLHLFAAPAKDERVAPFEAHHRLSLLHGHAHEFFDELLWRALAATALAHADDARRGRCIGHDGFAHQVVHQQHRGGLDRLEGLQRQQVGVARACAHQRATAAGAQVRGGCGRCGGRRGAGHGDVSEAV